MVIIRGTKKLRDRLSAPVMGTTGASTTLLGDWFATALFWRPQVALLVNERTFLAVFLPLAPASTLLERAPAAIGSVLRHLGAGEEFIANEGKAMEEVLLAPTNNRSVLGVMNEFAAVGKRLWGARLDDLEALSLRMADVPLGPLRDGSGSPWRELAAVLGEALSAPAASASPKGDVYQLKVTLLDTNPPIWRRVLVDGARTLDHVHEVIQAAFGWWNYHLHEFEVGPTRYGIPDPDDDWGPPTQDERRTRLADVASAGTSFQYKYDFGDGWEHTVTVERVLPPSTGVQAPVCVDGRRACPPEDCGGPWGYRELIGILADPSHPEYAARMEWVGGNFDAEAFDPSTFEENLRHSRLAAFDD